MALSACINGIRAAARLSRTSILGVLLIFSASGSAPCVNLVVNGDFESGLAAWNADSPGWGLDQAAPYSGTASLVLSSEAGDEEVMWQELEAIPGRVYRATCMVDCRELVTGAAGITLEALNARGDSYFGEYCWNASERSSGWLMLSWDLPWTLPDDCVRVVVRLRLFPGSVGTARFDQIRVTPLELNGVHAVLLEPKQKGRTTSALADRIAVGVRPAPSVADPSACDVELTVINDQELVVARSRSGLESSGGWDIIAADLPEIPPGLYQVSVDLIDRESDLSIACEELQMRIPSQSSPPVYLDRRGRCVVDGELFFPKGIYVAHSPDSLSAGTLDDIASLGINSVLNYYLTRSDDGEVLRYVDMLEQRGLRAAVSLCEYYDHRASGITDPMSALREQVRALKDHPALLTWYINDELSGDYIPQIQERYDWISREDPAHPVWQVLSGFGQNPMLHTDSADVLGEDNYPVWGHYANEQSVVNIRDVTRSTREVADAVMGGKAVWMVLECADLIERGPDYLPPTYSQILCLSYQALIGGARGLFFYEYGALARDGEEQKQVFRNALSHLDRLSPAVLGDDPTDESLVGCSDARVPHLTRSSRGKTHVLATNPEPESITVTFYLPPSIDAPTVEALMPDGETRTLAVEQGAFTDQLDPLGTRMYTISPSGTRLEITSHSTDSDYYTNDPVLLLSGTAYSASGIAAVIWEDQFGRSGACTVDNGDWTASLNLPEGISSITVTAIDGQGITESDRITAVYIESAPPPAWNGIAMVAVPVITAETDPKRSVGFTGSHWYAYSAAQRRSASYGSDSARVSWFDPPEETPGRGFWARFDSPPAIPRGRLVDQTQPCTVRLHQGWNLLGHPFVFPVRWEAASVRVRTLDGVESAMADTPLVVSPYSWGWTRQQAGSGGAYDYYRLDAQAGTEYLQPWCAYWVLARMECDLIIPPPEGIATE